jgi:hypothetical protein
MAVPRIRDHTRNGMEQQTRYLVRWYDGTIEFLTPCHRRAYTKALSRSGIYPRVTRCSVEGRKVVPATNRISRKWCRYWAHRRRHFWNALRSAASIGIPKVGVKRTGHFVFLGETPTTTGNWIASTPIPSQTLESRVTRLHGQDKVMLLAFARKILQLLINPLLTFAENRPLRYIRQGLNTSRSDDSHLDAFPSQSKNLVKPTNFSTSNASFPQAPAEASIPADHHTPALSKIINKRFATCGITTSPARFWPKYSGSPMTRACQQSASCERKK